MKLKLTTLLNMGVLILLIPMMSWAQKSDCTRWNLKSDVKSIKETSFSIKSDHITKDTIEYYYYNEFNTFGNKVVDAEYLPGGELVKSYTYTYDQNNKRTKETQLDTNGKLLMTISYLYDSVGHLLEDSSVDAEGNPDKAIRFTYDTKGNVSEDNSYGSDGKLQKKYSYQYDDMGRKVENSRFDSYGNPEGKTVYAYDEQNNVIKKSSYGSDNALKKILVYSYIYDSHHNWISKTTRVEGKVVNILEREIIYYQ